MNEKNVITDDPKKSVKVYSVNRLILNNDFNNTFANESTKVINNTYPILPVNKQQVKIEDMLPVKYSTLPKGELQKTLLNVEPGPVITAAPVEEEKGFIGKLVDKLIDKSNEHYWHPIYGAPARWKVSMQNGTNPLIGLKKTVVPAATGAFLIMGGRSVPGLAKTFFKLPLRTVWNVAPEVAVGTAGASAGNWFDKNILQGDGTLGTTVGGLVGVRQVLNLFERARRAMYRNITPFGYGNTPSSKSRGQEIKDVLKETFSTKPLPTEDADGIPILKWHDNLQQRVRFMDLDEYTLIRFRDQAMRKALKLQPLDYEPQIYRLNDDGITYSYDIDNINKIRLKPLPENLSKSDLQVNDGNIYFDDFTTNGGYVGVIKENGSDYMIDRWDLQPFKDDRTISKFIQKIPGIKNFEVIDFLRGDPFTVKHKLKYE